jgi:hypothetical protein
MAGWASKLVSKAPAPKIRFYTFEEEQQIMAEARALFESRDIVAPTWDQLGEGTQGVWCNMVKKEARWQ